MASLEERRHREDVAEVVVDHEDLRPGDHARLIGPPAASLVPSARLAATGLGDDRLRAGCGSSRGSHGRTSGEQLGGVDRLGHVVVGAGVDAAFALAGHDLAGDGDDREVLNCSSARMARMVS